MENLQKLLNYNVVLASQSPRRQQLLKELGINFSIQVKPIDELYPEGIQKEEIPMFLAKLKADAFSNLMADNDLVITADTIVWMNGKVLGKPKDKADAESMLKSLSDNKHTVYTGVCLKTKDKEKVFSARTDVFFRKLTDSEISFYIDNYKPFDKAGSYGVQEWIGYIGIERIDGSYFNVMGLPVQRLYDELLRFID